MAHLGDGTDRDARRVCSDVETACEHRRPAVGDGRLGDVLEREGVPLALTLGQGNVSAPKADPDLGSWVREELDHSCAAAGRDHRANQPAPETTGMPTPTPLEVPRSISTVTSKLDAGEEITCASTSGIPSANGMRCSAFI